MTLQYKAFNVKYSMVNLQYKVSNDESLVGTNVMKTVI
jgi:hypothetical protein